MRRVVAAGFGLALGLGGCAAPVPIPEGFMRPFACPTAGTRTVIERADGPPYATVWRGAEPDDADMCVSTNGSGTTQRSRLFGRFQFNDDLGGTTEEKSGARKTVADLLAGRYPSAGFILRGRTGEQSVEHWSVKDLDTLSIGDRSVRTVHFTINYTYSANGRPSLIDVWFAPDYNLFVRSAGSLDVPKTYTWRVVKITGSERAE